MTQFFKLLSCYMPKIIQRSMLNIYLLKYQLTTQYIHIPFFQKQIIRTLHTCKLTSYPFPRVFHLLRFWEVQKRLFQDLTKINNWDYIKLKKLPDSKRNNHHSERATYRIGENICRPCIWKRVNLQNLLGIPTAQQQKKLITQVSNRQRNKTFLQRRCANGK